MRFPRTLRCGLACCLIVATACGSRLSRGQIIAQNVVTAGGTAGGSGPTAAGSITSGGAAPANLGPASGNGPAGSTGQGGGPTAGPSSGNAVTGSVAPSAALPSGSGATGPKAPLIVGMVGWLSGIGGGTSTYSRDVLVAWSKWVNAKGGINGHPIQLYVADDGGDESRSVSIVHDFVENKHVIALLNYSGASVVGVGNYVKTKNVPIIGGNVTEQTWTQNPMLFPQDAATNGHFWGAARLASAAGVKKIATVYCTEVAACSQSNSTFVQYAHAEGLDVVYQGQISFTQPDYTAECLQMRNSGAQAVVPITENTSTVRLAQSCGRQGYNPIYDLQAVNDGMAAIPQFDNSIGNLASFPWFVHTGPPGVADYVQALQQYAPNRLTDGVDVQTDAWIIGTIFEKAAARVSDTPTAQEILQGLWKMKNETFNGLLLGGEARTFTQGQPTAETFCVYNTRIQGGKWTAPQGLTPVCR
ncbi:MAG: ABC transporter substrate-binding protein [Acidimicrobiales bacterium]